MTRRATVRLASGIFALTLATACGDDGGGAAGDGSSSTSGTAAPSSSSTTNADATTAGVTSSTTAGSSTTDDDSADDSTSTGGPAVDPFCGDLGLPAAELLDGEGSDWGQVAGDFTLETTFGPWSMRDTWTGCDSFVFINDQGSSAAGGLRNAATTELFERSALNVHYIFLTTSGDTAAGAEAWQTTIGGALAGLDAAGQAHWASRVHFVTEASGSVVEFLQARPDQLTFGIDRAQRWDDPGSTSDTTTGAFAPAAPVLGYTARYYNARHAQDLRLAAQRDVTEVVVLDEYAFEPECEGSCAGLPNGPFANSNNWQSWPAAFPDAAAMADFDTMDVVVTAQCGPSPDADCGHWDYEAVVNLCETEACDADVHEFIRWITPYARPGRRRWVFDATHMLGRVRDGGMHYLQFGMIWNMNPSVWDIRIRLRDTDKGAAVTQTVPTFAGNRGFNDDYNTWEQVEFTPPEGTTKVEFVALISGHGQDAGNCAEWCEHQHEFTVNGETTLLREFPGEVSAQRCGDAVDDGVVPGQWGNWTPGRAGWCPGAPIEPWVVDITDDVTIGQPNTLDYRGLFAGVPVQGNRGRIRLSSYLVYSE
ncbi:MAG: peptide-N-glycosidase F-related protein [Myxococcota bacterium]